MANLTRAQRNRQFTHRRRMASYNRMQIDLLSFPPNIIHFGFNYGNSGDILKEELGHVKVIRKRALELEKLLKRLSKPRPAIHEISDDDNDDNDNDDQQDNDGNDDNQDNQNNDDNQDNADQNNIDQDQPDLDIAPANDAQPQLDPEQLRAQNQSLRDKIRDLERELAEARQEQEQPAREDCQKHYIRVCKIHCCPTHNPNTECSSPTTNKKMRAELN